MFLIDLCSPFVKHPHISSLVSFIFSFQDHHKRVLSIWSSDCFCNQTTSLHPTNLDALSWCSFLDRSSSAWDKRQKGRKLIPGRIARLWWRIHLLLHTASDLVRASSELSQRAHSPPTCFPSLLSSLVVTLLVNQHPVQQSEKRSSPSN